MLETERLELIPLTPHQLRLWIEDVSALDKELSCSYKAEPMEGFFLEIVKGQLEITQNDSDNYLWHSFWFLIRKKSIMKKILIVILAALIFLTGCSKNTVLESENNAELQAASATSSPVSVSPAISEEKKMIQLSMVTMESGFALTDENHVLKTTDGGKTWSDFYTIKATDIKTGLCPVIYSVDDNILYIAAHYDSNTNFISTIDGGKTWSYTAIHSGLSWVNNDISGYCLDFIDADNGYLLIDSTPGAGQMLKALYKTTDAGATWEMVTGDGGGQDNISGIIPSGISGYPHGISFSSLEKGWIMCGSNGAPPYGFYIYKTNNSGKSWSPINFPEFPQEFSKWDESELYVSVSEPSFYESDNLKGKMIMIFHPYTQEESDTAYLYSISNHDTWVLEGKCNTIINDYKFIDDKNGYGLDYAGSFCKTEDGGFTWHKVK